MKKFVLGDIHGRYTALKEVLKKSGFDYKHDKLIVLGDVVDGGFNTSECVEELLKIHNLVYLLGNHCCWFINHIKTGWADEIWIQQGGANTLRSYGAKVEEAEYISDESKIDRGNLKIPESHRKFFNEAKFYHIEDNMAFVHGGFNIEKGLKNTDKQTLVWDRSIIEYAKKKPIPKYDKVFIGHTTTSTQDDNTYTPIKYNNLWMLDTGAGWKGKLTIMNINTEEYWQSEEQNRFKFGGKYGKR